LPLATNTFYKCPKDVSKFHVINSTSKGKLLILNCQIEITLDTMMYFEFLILETSISNTFPQAKFSEEVYECGISLHLLWVTCKRNTQRELYSPRTKRQHLFSCNHPLQTMNAYKQNGNFVETFTAPYFCPLPRHGSKQEQIKIWHNFVINLTGKSKSK
jgi:hypothetical protein